MNTQEKNVLCNNNKKKSCLKETLIGTLKINCLYDQLGHL